MPDYDDESPWGQSKYLDVSKMIAAASCSPSIAGAATRIQHPDSTLMPTMAASERPAEPKHIPLACVLSIKSCALSAIG